MNKAQTRVLEMLLSVRQFGLSRAAAFPANSRGRELYNAVDTSIRNMESHAATQALHAHALREKTAQRKVALDALRRSMGAISRTARSMSASAPGLAERFRRPPNKDGRVWVATAHAFVTEAEPLAEEFVGRGMPPDFVDELKAHILAFEQSEDGQAQKSAEQVAATAALAEAAEQGLGAVRELDPIVRNVYASNDAELAAWESASHVARAPRRAGAEAPQARPAPAPTQV